MSACTTPLPADQLERCYVCGGLMADHAVPSLVDVLTTAVLALPPDQLHYVLLQLGVGDRPSRAGAIKPRP